MDVVQQKGSILYRRVLNRLGIRSDKVFAIGFNKTGTSSIHSLFKTLRRPAYHGTKWRSCDNEELFRTYDCFSDGPPKDVARLDRMFPNSKFILQVRDCDSWIYSRLSHIERRKSTDESYKVGPEWDDSSEAIKNWILRRNEYHLEVLSYFEGRSSDLLVVNFIRDEDSATRIANFMGYPGRYEKPRKNVSPRKEPSPEHVEMVRDSIEELGIPVHELKNDIFCPSLARPTAWPADTSALDEHTCFAPGREAS